MSQSQNVHVLGLQRPKQPRLVNSLSPIDGEALGAYLAKVQLCSAYEGSQRLSSKSQSQSIHVSMNGTTISGTCGMYSNVIDASVPLGGQSLSTSGFSEEKTL